MGQTVTNVLQVTQQRRGYVVPLILYVPRILVVTHTIAVTHTLAVPHTLVGSSPAFVYSLTQSTEDYKVKHP